MSNAKQTNGLTFASPGSVNGVAGIEMVMNRIAHELNMDPWEVRRVNLAMGHGKDPS